MPATPRRFSRPFVVHADDATTLHFSAATMQSRMHADKPDELVLDYTRLMMGFLLFQRRPQRIAMIGLGGGSLLKFCYRQLPTARIDVVEVNPHVIALREAFHVPPDDARLRVHCADGAQFVREWDAAIDVLLIDAYDRRGIPARLSTHGFYDDCRRALGRGGVVVANLGESGVAAHVAHLRDVFDEAVLIVTEADGGNRVAFAWRAGSSRRSTALRRPAHFGQAAWLSLLPAFARIGAAASAC